MFLSKRKVSEVPTCKLRVNKINLLTNRVTLLKTVINVLHVVDCSGEDGLLNVNESVVGFSGLVGDKSSAQTDPSSVWTGRVSRCCSAKG